MRSCVTIAAGTMLVLALRHAQALTLCADGKTDYVIVLGRDAIAPEETAARELQGHLQSVTGARLPIHKEGDVPPGAGQIVVGPSAAFRSALGGVDMNALGRDGIVMKTVGGNLYLAGGRPRGTLYAVYTFLEDVVGCRWWSSKESHVPKRPTLDVPTLDVVYAPKLQYREAFYRDAFDGVFAARCKCNGHFERVTPEYGGHYRLLGWCHTFNQLLPPEKYFGAHPEWYSEINGKRVAERSQLCLTNEEMRKELTKNALEWIRKEPDAGMISIAQNDWNGACECANCCAVVEREGAQSGMLVEFVNKVAGDIEREFPGFLVETLAYQYTRQPPKHVAPRRNVVVRLCTIECSYAEPLASGPQNEKFRRDIEGWSAVAPQLYIWDYVTNFANYILPHPNLRVLAPNIRFFVSHNAIGLFEQGDSGSTCGDFVEMRAWALAHLMWDPSRDEKALLREFREGYYGPAAAPLQEYLDVIHDSAARAGVFLRCYMPDTSAWMTLDDLNRATELFDEAAKRVEGDPILKMRVRRARMPLDHAWLQRYHSLRRIARMRGKPFLGPADPVALYDDFVKSAHAFQLGQYAEGRRFAEYEAGLRARFRPIGPPPKPCEGLPEEDWVDAQDGEFTLHNLGTWVTIADDEKASDRKAARMPGGHTQWAVQLPISGDFAGTGPWRCYVVARCQAKAAKGHAFQLGLYDTHARKAVAGLRETIEHAADGEYRTYDLGAHALKGGMYVWVAPCGNGDAVEAVYVDRVYFMQER